MSSLNVALLDESARDDSTILPALQKLLQLAYSEDTDEQLEVCQGVPKIDFVKIVPFGIRLHMVESISMTQLGFAVSLVPLALLPTIPSDEVKFEKNNLIRSP